MRKDAPRYRTGGAPAVRPGGPLEEELESMSRSPRWSLFALLATAAIVFMACSGAASPSPSASSGAASAPAASAASSEPFTATSYPTSGDAPCGVAPYTGTFKKLTAVDAKTVRFDLCAPDVAFLSKIAFSSFAINDTKYLDKAVADGSIVEKPNGTGPYMLQEWARGDHITLVANPNYTGPHAAKAPTLIIKWSKEAAQRLVELQSGSVDGIDN